MRNLFKSIKSKSTNLPNFRMIHHVDEKTYNNFLSNYSPVFFLNTGRSGSAFLNNIFKYHKEVEAHHEAFPNLMMLTNFAFHNQKETKILRKIFESARLELILNAFIKNKLFIETNHCLVFYAYQIKSIFPKARFVHLLRHPGDFIRSGIMKGWHKNNTIWENNRIRMDNKVEWSSLDQTEKLAWVWYATHLYIEKFKKTYGYDILTIRFEDLVSTYSTFGKMIKFIDNEFEIEKEIILKIQKNKINKISIAKGEPVNIFKLPDYPQYQNWTDEQRFKVIKYCKKIANKYDYRL